MGKDCCLLATGVFLIASWTLAASADTGQEQLDDVRRLRADNKLLKATLAARDKKIAALEEEVEKLKVEIARLRAVAPPEAASSSEAPAVESNGAVQSPVSVNVGGGELRVRFQFSTLYIPENIPRGEDVLVSMAREEQCGYSHFFFVGYRAKGDTVHKKPIEGFFKLNGGATKLICRSSNEEVIRVEDYDDDEGLCVEALAPGVANIEVSLARHKVLIPLKVVQIPIRTGDFRVEGYTEGRSHTKEKVIERLGIPSDREETFVRWPNSAYYAGQHFTPRAGAIWVVHRWKYDRYPGAEIVFVGNSAAYFARSAQTFEIADPP